EYSVFVRHVAQRQEEAVNVLQERDERAQRERPRQHLSAANADDERGGHRGKEANDGKEEREIEERAQGRAAIVQVERVELLEVVFLAIEELDNLRAGDILGDIGVDTRQPYPDRAEVVAHGPLEVRRHQQQRRDDDEDDQRQQPVLEEQDDDDTYQREDIADERDGPGRE